MADAAQLRKTLPSEVQETLTHHEAAGTTNTLRYRAATMQYYHRYLCRMDPWPEPMNRSHEASSGAVYREMWGPSEFFATGNLMNYDRTGRLREIATPTLYTCGRYDEATPEATAWYRSLTPAAEMLIFENSAHMPHLEETDAYLSTIRGFLDRAH
jgi:proline iminopeptidase